MSALAPAFLRSRRRRGFGLSVLTYGILIGWAIFTLFPILWVYTSALKTPEQVFEMPPRWIFSPTLHNFEVVFGLTIPTELETVTEKQQLAAIQSKFPRYFLNSLIVSIGATTLSLTIGSLAAYSLTRFRIIGRQFFLTGIILTRLIPPVTLVVPFYVLWRNVGLTDTHVGLILVYLTFQPAICDLDAAWLFPRNTD